MVTVTNTVVELARHGEDELVGTFTPAEGSMYQIRLIKIDEPTTQAGKSLLGHWDGTIQYSGRPLDDPRRTLYVISVDDHDGHAKGWWGFKDRWFERVAVDMAASGRFLTIRFVEASGSTIRLTLVSDTDLVGTIRFLGFGYPQWIEPSMHLYRVK